MTKVRRNLMLIVVSLWVGVNQLYWSLAPHLATYNDASLHTSAYQMLHGTTLIGPDIVMLLLGVALKYQLDRHREAWLINVWLNTLVLGCLVCLFSSLATNYVTASAVYDAALPILRNTYPLIVGAMLGVLISQILDQLDRKWRRLTLILILGIIIMPIFTTPNMFGWTESTNSLFYGLMFTLGWQLLPTLQKRFTVSQTVAIGVSTYLLNCFLQFIMPTFSIDGTTISRYTSSSNILTVLVAMTVTLLVLKWVGEFKIPRWFISYLVIIGNVALTLVLEGEVAKRVGHSSLKTGILAITASIVGLLLALLWEYCLRLKPAVLVSHQIDQFTQVSLTNQWLRVQKWIRHYRPTIFQGITAYLLGLLSMLLMNNSWQIKPNMDSYNVFAYTLGQRQLLIILNAVIIFAAIKFLQALTRRYWISLLTSVILVAGIIIANREKIAARDEPILPSDLAMLRVGNELAEMISPMMWFLLGIALILVILLMNWLEHRYALKIHWSVKRTATYLLLLPLLLLTSLMWNQEGTPLNNLLTTFGDSPMFYNQLSGARINGPIVQYLNNVDVTVMEQPSGYSKQTMQQVVTRYQRTAQSINRHRSNDLSKQTIIFNLSESFANPNRVPGVELKNDPIPFVNSMKKHNTGGIMISSGYGGGTANMEYMTLTGYSLSNFSPTLPTPYTQLVPTLTTNPSIVDSFHHAIAIHPYIGAFYSRIEVYKKFGFDKFLYLGSKYPIKHRYKIDRSPYLSDKTAYANTLDQLRNYHQGQFINLVTMQNHFPYDQHYYNNLTKYEASKVSSGTNIAAVNDFSTGIHYTDNYLRTFIKQIDRMNKPITVVFYGDHLPGIYGNDMTKDGLKLHETDYFIYSNKYARQHGATNLRRDTKYVVPNDFIAMVAKQTNSKVNWYQALLTRVYEKLPAMTLDTSQSSVNTYNSSSEFVNQQGKIVKKSSFTKQQRHLWHDYQLIQYDVTAGKHYTLKYFR